MDQTNRELDKTMCQHPWNSVAVRPNGLVIPCCNFSTVDPTLSKSWHTDSKTHQDFLNSKPWIELKQTMLDGKKSPGCVICWNEERVGGTSMRMYSLPPDKKYKTMNDPNKIEILDISFSNLCNLACTMCNRQYSTTWAKEDYLNGRLDKLRDSVMLEPEDIISKIDLSNLQVLKTFGGEPMMDQKRFIRLLDSLDRSKLKLIIITNGTQLPSPEFTERMLECSFVDYEISLDGLEGTNNWQRWPGKFSTVVENMKHVQEMLRGHRNYKMTIHSSVGAYNVSEFPEFVLWLLYEFPEWRHHVDIIRHPVVQNLSALPETYKELLAERYRALTIRPNAQNKVDVYRLILSWLEKDDGVPVKSFIEYTEKLAKERRYDLSQLSYWNQIYNHYLDSQ